MKRSRGRTKKLKGGMDPILGALATGALSAVGGMLTKAIVGAVTGVSSDLNDRAVAAADNTAPEVATTQPNTSMWGITKDVVSRAWTEHKNEVIASLIQNVVPAVSNAVTNYLIKKSDEDSPERTAAVVIGGIGSYMSSILRGMTHQEASKAVEAVSNGLSAASEIIDKQRESLKSGNPTEDVNRAYEIVMKVLGTVLSQSLQGRPKEAINGVISDLGDIYKQYSSFPVEDKEGQQFYGPQNSLTNMVAQSDHFKGFGTVKYGGKKNSSGKVYKFNTDWLFSNTDEKPTIPFPSLSELSGGAWTPPEEFANFTTNFATVPEGYSLLNTTSSNTPPGTDPLLNTVSNVIGAASRPWYSTLFWGTMPYLIHPIINGVGGMLKSFSRFIKPKLSEGAASALTSLEDWATEHKDLFHMAGSAGISSLDASYRDQMRQNAAAKLYKIQKERVAAANQRISADNQSKIDRANMEYIDLIKQTKAQNEQKAKDFENTLRLNEPTRLLERIRLAKEIGDTEGAKEYAKLGFFQRLFTNPNYYKAINTPAAVTAEYKTTLRDLGLEVTKKDSEEVIEEYNDLFRNGTPKEGNPPSMPEKFTNKLSEKLGLSPPTEMPLPSGPKHVQLTPLLTEPTPSAAMFETPFLDQARRENAIRFAPYMNKLFSYNGYNNMFSQNSDLLDTALSSHITANPLSQSTSVYSGPSSASTSALTTVRTPAYYPTQLTSVTPLQLSSMKSSNIFDSSSTAVDTLDKISEKKKKKKFKPEEYSDINPSSARESLPKHMRDEPYNDLMESYKVIPMEIRMENQRMKQQNGRLVHTLPLKTASSLRNELPISIFPASSNLRGLFPSENKPSKKRRRRI